MKKKILKTMCALFAILLFAVMAIGSGSTDEPQKVGEVTDDSNISIENQTEGEKENDKSEETQKPSTPQSDKTEYKVGESLQTKEFKIVYLSSGVFESDNMFIQPEEGNKYIYITLYCENVSSSDKNISYIDFECYADGYACDANYMMDSSLSATISSGRSAIGNIGFEVPENAKSIEFEYKPNMFLDKKYTFVYEGVKDSGINPSSNKSETANAYKVGDIIESKSERITYLSCGEYVSDNMFIQPKDGYKFIFLEFEFENLAASDDNISSFYFSCYADGASCESSYYGDDQLSATISKGRKAKGKVYFEVPKNASVIEIEYDSSFWSSNKITFAYSGK